MTPAITTALLVHQRAGLSQERSRLEQTRVADGTDTSPDKTNLNTQLPQSTTDELAERTPRADGTLPEGSSARDRVRTYLDFIAEHSPGWVTYQVLAEHDPGDEAARVRRQAREAAVAALAEVVGGSRGHRDDFALWGYLGFLDDACLRWVRAGCPDNQRHSLIDATLGCLERALDDWRKRGQTGQEGTVALLPRAAPERRTDLRYAASGPLDGQNLAILQVDPARQPGRSVLRPPPSLFGYSSRPACRPQPATGSWPGRDTHSVDPCNQPHS